MLIAEVRFEWKWLIWLRYAERLPVFHLQLRFAIGSVKQKTERKINALIRRNYGSMPSIESKSVVYFLPFSIWTSTVVDVELMMEHE